jgi:hypothetical protein
LLRLRTRCRVRRPIANPFVQWKSRVKHWLRDRCDAALWGPSGFDFDRGLPLWDFKGVP